MKLAHYEFFYDRIARSLLLLTLLHAFHIANLEIDELTYEKCYSLSNNCDDRRLWFLSFMNLFEKREQNGSFINNIGPCL